MARAGLRGYERDQSHVFPGLTARGAAWLTRTVPRALAARVATGFAKPRRRSERTCWRGSSRQLHLDRPAVRAWMLYDWANSAMYVVIVTAIFPTFFSAVAAQGLPPVEATYRFSLATTLGLTIIAVLSPILGAIADHSAAKKRLLGAFLVFGATAVAAMFFIRHGQWVFAALLFILANIGVNGSFVFYDSLLPHVAAPDEMDRISTAGLRARLPRRRALPRGLPRHHPGAGGVRAPLGSGPDARPRRRCRPASPSSSRRSGGPGSASRSSGGCPNRPAGRSTRRRPRSAPCAPPSAAWATPSASCGATGRRSCCCWPS